MWEYKLNAFFIMRIIYSAKKITTKQDVLRVELMAVIVQNAPQFWAHLCPCIIQIPFQQPFMLCCQGDGPVHSWNLAARLCPGNAAPQTPEFLTESIQAFGVSGIRTFPCGEWNNPWKSEPASTPLFDLARSRQSCSMYYKLPEGCDVKKLKYYPHRVVQGATATADGVLVHSVLV